MAKKFAEKKRVISNLFFSLSAWNKILKELTLEMIDLKNISLKPMIGIVFFSSKLFNIGDIRRSFVLKECLYCRGSEGMLRSEVILFRKIMEVGNENVSDWNVDISVLNVFPKRASAARRGKVLKKEDHLVFQLKNECLCTKDRSCNVQERDGWCKVLRVRFQKEEGS